jgi:tRNA pseudouridine55 synthase
MLWLRFVGNLRRITGNKKIKVGHAGTLDPMATGLLIVLAGNMTKQQDSFMKKDKVYEAEVTLGARQRHG